MANQQVVCSSGDDNALPFRGMHLAHGLSQMRIKAVAEKQVDAGVKGLADDCLAGSVRGRETKSADLKAGSAQSSVGETVWHSNFFYLRVM